MWASCDHAADLALASQDQALLKASLLIVILREPVSSVLSMEADAIATIARSAFATDEWPQLLPWVHQCCISPDAKHKATGLRVLTALLERVGLLAPCNATPPAKQLVLAWSCDQALSICEVVS